MFGFLVKQKTYNINTFLKILENAFFKCTQKDNITVLTVNDKFILYNLLGNYY